ncbi:hypothetical protein GJV44_p00036 (plasmid) [Candidatus Vallotia cooleyia]|nr:hypothetical protein GJV44_p00036 [Candidatus Vallotia cooleyia]
MQIKSPIIKSPYQRPGVGAWNQSRGSAIILYADLQSRTVEATYMPIIQLLKTVRFLDIFLTLTGILLVAHLPQRRLEYSLEYLDVAFFCNERYLSLEESPLLQN